MKNLLCLVCLLWSVAGVMAEKVPVFIYAGQSNADGREFTKNLPEYMMDNGQLPSSPYQHLHWASICGKPMKKDFEKRVFKGGERYAFCDVTNYWIDQAIGTDFYAIKCAYGGTAISPGVTVAKLPIWYADTEWMKSHNAYKGDDITQAEYADNNSLTKNLTVGVSSLIDGTLKAIKGGYDVKAIMWHQGESDRKAAGNYYVNFKTMIAYMRQAIYSKTGDKKDLHLPFIFGTVCHRSRQYSAGVEEAQKRVAAEDPNVYYIDMQNSTLLSDNLHFDREATEYLGKMMYNKLVELKLVKGRALKVEGFSVESKMGLVSVAPYSGNRKAALSYTFDDGLQDQYTMAYPEMKKRGIRATFGIIGSKIGGWIKASTDAKGSMGSPAMTWDMVREMQSDGFEIASHGWQHKSLLKLNGDAFSDEIDKNDSALIANTGQRPMTFIYPYNAKNDSVMAIVEKGRISSRTKQKSFGGGDSEESMNSYVKGVLGQGSWGVVMIHGIATGYAHFTVPEQLFRHWDYVASLKKELWVAPFCEVAAYMKERENVKLNVVSDNTEETVVKVSMTLDAQMYHQPLTFLFNEYSKSATQDGKTLDVTYRNGQTIINGVNPSGGEVIIKKSKNAQHLTPVMGWSSWNTYHVNISEELIRRQADAMVSMGLKDAGYRYVNIDDGFFGGRDADGRLIVHPTRFPNGMKPVADYIHKLGMKAGLYSEAGCATCGSIYDNDSLGIGSGMYGHEKEDARLFFRDWGYDFIKIDYCGGKRQHLNEKEQYTRICDAIRQAAEGREVSVNICRWAFPGIWAADIARSWRISSDIRPRWNSVKNIIEKNMYLSAFCHDGHYNDMDMLEVGRGLKPEEEDTHFAMWCVMSSPLLIGCDLETIPQRSLKLITNEELIAINQDSLGLQAYVVQRDGDCYVLAKDIETRRGLTRAVAFYNSGNTDRRISVPLTSLEMGGKVKVRELISRQDRPDAVDMLEEVVPAHGTRIFRLTAEQRLVPTEYEAENAMPIGYDDLDERKYPVVFQYDENASGNMTVARLGGSKENRIIFNNVYSEKNGKRWLTIHYVPAVNRQLETTVNGRKYTISNLKSQGANATANIPVQLRKGMNTIELGNDTAITVDIDKISVTSEPIK